MVSVADNERMFDILQQTGVQTSEGRVFLCHEHPPSSDMVSDPRIQNPISERNEVKLPSDQRIVNDVTKPRIAMAFAELPGLASDQQHQIEDKQQVLADMEPHPNFVKQPNQQQQVRSQKKLQKLMDEDQKVELTELTALEERIEEKRLSKQKLWEETEQMNKLFQQNQRELLSTKAKVKELLRQMEILKSTRRDRNYTSKLSAEANLNELCKDVQRQTKSNQEQNPQQRCRPEELAMGKHVDDPPAHLGQEAAPEQKNNGLMMSSEKNLPQSVRHDRIHTNKWSVAANLNELCKDVQRQTKSNQEQNPQQRCRPKEVTMGKHVNDLPAYLGQKAAPQQKKNGLMMSSEKNLSQQAVSTSSKARAAGWPLQTSFSSGTFTVQASNSLLKRQTRSYLRAMTVSQAKDSRGQPAGHVCSRLSSDLFLLQDSASFSGKSMNSAEQADDGEIAHKKKRLVSSFSVPHSLDRAATLSPFGRLRKIKSSDVLWYAQTAHKSMAKVCPPVAIKSKRFQLPLFGQTRPFGSRPKSSGYFWKFSSSVTSLRKKQKLVQPQQLRPRVAMPPQVPAVGQDQALSPNGKQDSPLASKVQYVTPQSSEEIHLPPSQKSSTVGARSIRSMFMQQKASRRAVAKTQTRNIHFSKLCSKSVIARAPNQQPEKISSSNQEQPGTPQSATEPISSAQKKYKTAWIPRPLRLSRLFPFFRNSSKNRSDADLETKPVKKQNLITEPEGPNIQKCFSQKTTLGISEINSIPSESSKLTTVASSPKSPAEIQNFHPRAVPKKEMVAVSIEPVFTEEGESTSTEENEISTPSPRLYCDSKGLPDTPRLVQSHIKDPNLKNSLSPLPSCSSEERKRLGEASFRTSLPGTTRKFSLTPGKRTSLRKAGSKRITREMKVRFSPLALLLDSSLEGEFDLIQRTLYELDDPNLCNDEGITALHNAICAGHIDIVRFLVHFGVNINAADLDGWTPLHCAASRNNLQICKFLVESGAAVFAMTYSDMQTAAQKCEEIDEGYIPCSKFLHESQAKMGVINESVVYALWDYEPQRDDELPMKEGDLMTVIRKEDKDETEWWWVRLKDKEGYVPRNFLGLHPRIKQRQRSLA